MEHRGRSETTAERLDRNWGSLTPLGAALAGTTVIVFEAVLGHVAAVVSGVVAVVAFATFWFALPLWMRVFPPGGRGTRPAADER